MTGSSNARSADALTHLEPLTTVETGRVEVPEGGGPVALPGLAGNYVSVKAGPDNGAVVYLHGAGSAEGWPLAAGEETGLKPVDNLSRYELSGTAGDAIYYEVIS